MSNIEIDLVDRYFYQSIYTVVQVVLITRPVKLIGKKQFTATTLDLEDKAFVVYDDEACIVQVASISQNSDVYPSSRAQIASLKTDETSTSIFAKNTDFANVLFKELAAKLMEYTGIYDQAIDKMKRQQLTQNLIYRLRPIELEILKTYIMTKWANCFIRLSKSTIGTSILIVRKQDESF